MEDKNMRQIVFLIILAYSLMHFGLVANPTPPDKPSQESERRTTKFKEVPVPEEVKKKLHDKAMVSDGGNTYYALIPPNDRQAQMANLAIYICAGARPNTHVRVTKAGDAEPFYDKEIADPYGVIALCRNTGIKGEYICLENSLELTAHINDYDQDMVTMDKGFKIEALTNEIYVYVGSFREMSCDGYMVLPLTGLGNRYIHCSQSDNAEDNMIPGQPSEPPDVVNTPAAKRTGFSCIAIEDNTRIYMVLKTNRSFCLTFKRNVAREQPYFSPILQENEI